MKFSIMKMNTLDGMMKRMAGATALAVLFCSSAYARTWTSSDGAKTFEGELKSYDSATGIVTVTMANGKAMKFQQDKLSAADVTFLKENGQPAATPVATNKAEPAKSGAAADLGKMLERSDGKPADMTKPVQVFILMGQSNMVGLGKVSGPDGSLEFAVKEKKKYPYLVEDDGKWVERKDTRFVQVMQGKGELKNEWMTISGKTMGPEYGLGHPLGNTIAAPVMILKSCIGNRSLGWDLLPPGSEKYEFEGKTYAGYKDSPDSWPTGTEPKPIGWYAGKQYDDDVANAKKVLTELDKHYPEATKYEVAGFFFWQGEKDGGNPAHAAKYEENLVRFIKQLRKDFESPNAKFVLATLGESTKGSGGNGGKILEAQLAVDGTTGKYPEFKGNVATVYANPLSLGGSGNSHYNGNAETYMNVGEAMGKAMVELLQTSNAK